MGERICIALIIAAAFVDIGLLSILAILSYVILACITPSPSEPRPLRLLGVGIAAFFVEGPAFLIGCCAIIYLWREATNKPLFESNDQSDPTKLRF